MVKVDGGVVLDLLRVLQDGLRLGRQSAQLLHKIVVLLLTHPAQQVGKVEAQQIDHRQLSGVGFRGSHGDLRPSPGIKHVVRLPGDGGPHHVDNGQNPGAQPLGLPHGGQGVDGLTRLADDQRQGMFGHNGGAVPELRGQGDLHRDAQQPLQNVLGSHPHVVGGAAGNDVQPVQVLQFPLGDGHIVQHHFAVPQAGRDGVPDGLGLLHDLLEHKVLIAALFRRRDLPMHAGGLLLHRLDQGVIHLDSIRGKHRHLAVIQVADLPGVADQGGNVAGQHGKALAQAQDQGGVLPHRHQLIRLVGAHNAQSIGSLNPVEHLGHRVQQVPLVVVVQQLGHHLSVGLRDELDPLGLQEFL